MIAIPNRIAIAEQCTACLWVPFSFNGTPNMMRFCRAAIAANRAFTNRAKLIARIGAGAFFWAAWDNITLHCDKQL